MAEYELDQIEQRRADDLRAQIQAEGGLFQHSQTGELVVTTDGTPVPVALEPLPGRSGRRYAMDRTGTIWRFAPKGSKKIPHRRDGGGAPWRGDMVEMWGGNWRKVYDKKPPRGEQPTGPYRYAKRLLWVPVGPGVNEHPGTTHLEWYTNRKGFQHPLAAPHDPTKEQIAIMEGQEHEIDQAVYALGKELAEDEGIDIADVMDDPQAVSVRTKPKRRRKTKKKARKRRTNKPDPEPVVAVEAAVAGEPVGDSL